MVAYRRFPQNALKKATFSLFLLFYRPVWRLKLIVLNHNDTIKYRFWYVLLMSFCLYEHKNDVFSSGDTDLTVLLLKINSFLVSPDPLMKWKSGLK